MVQPTDLAAIPSQSLHFINKFIARHPIFDRNKAVLGYELLFRTSLDNFFSPPNSGSVSAQIVDQSLLFGLDALTGGRKAFINFTREALLQDYAMLLPKDKVVVEVLEDIVPDDEVLKACIRLKNAGFLIALDDFIPSKEGNPLTGVADIIKVDFPSTADRDRKELVDQYSPRGISMLAEKVETQDDVNQGMQQGYDYFQGYFFCKPQVLSTRDIPGFKLNYIRLLQATNRPELDLNEIDNILRQEPSLLYRLLRCLNSALFGLRAQITSTRHALALLGESNLRKWASVVALMDLAGDKPSELIQTCLVRARLCELLVRPLRLSQNNTDIFLLGLLSLMDAILDCEMKDVLEEIPVSDEIRHALLGKSSRLRCMLDMVSAQENGDWTRVSRCLECLGMAPDQYPMIYVTAVQWVGSIFEP